MTLWGWESPGSDDFWRETEILSSGIKISLEFRKMSKLPIMSIAAAFAMVTRAAKATAGGHFRLDAQAAQT